MKDGELYTRLESELQDSISDRSYANDMAPKQIKTCSTCATKTERSCDECENCNWCIVTGRWRTKSDGSSEWVEDGDPVGSCVLTERFTEASCSNYDEKRIIKKKNLFASESSYKESIIPFAMAFVSYLITSQDIYHCRTRKSSSFIVYYLISFLVMMHLYRLYMKWSSEKDETIDAEEIENLRRQRRGIAFISIIVFLTFGATLTYVQKKCAFPLGMTMSIMMGIAVSFLFSRNITPSTSSIPSTINLFFNDIFNLYSIVIGVVLFVIITQTLTVYVSYTSKRRTLPMSSMNRY